MSSARAEVTTLKAKEGRGEQGNKGASLNLAVVLCGSWQWDAVTWHQTIPVLWFSQWEYKGLQGLVY